MEPRNWSDLDVGILIMIFEMVGILDVLKNAVCVCRAWREVAKDEPQLWRRIDLTKCINGYNVHTPKDPIMRAIDMSGGRLEEFWIKDFGDDHLLQYLSDRTSALKSLRLLFCDQISEERLINTVKKQPLLEDLQITFGSWSVNLPELLGKELPNLKQFIFNIRCINEEILNWEKFLFHTPFVRVDHLRVDRDEEAVGIAKNMHQLRSLQLIGRSTLTNKGLKAILEGCPHLESLDIRRCSEVNMDSDVRARCARLTTLRIPEDSLDDYEFRNAFRPILDFP